MAYIVLNQNYGYNQYSVSGLSSGSTIDATAATWIVSNSRNQNPDADTSYSSGSGQLNTYPVKISSAPNLLLKGGAIWGEVPQTSDWDYTYNNSAAIRVENAPGVIIDDWRIDKAWDAIRIASGSQNFLIDDAYISNVRDDAVENDSAYGGTIRDSLFDGVTSGISLHDSSNDNGSMNTITLENVFIRNKVYNYQGEMTHASPFKMGPTELMPDLRIINSVFAIEDVDHRSQSRLETAWENVVESRGNVFLNLSDTPLPSDYPKPPAGFTILQGQQARDYWEACKQAWLANHDGVNDVAVTPLPPLPGTGGTTTPVPPPPTTSPTPTPTPDTGTSTGTTNTINGTSSSNTLTGTSANDAINGFSGDDKIYGKSGVDTLTGGSGRDKFYFDTPLSGGVDKITDFNPVDDYIYLENSIFTKLTSTGRLSGSYFEDGAGVKADDRNDYILYDTQTGVLSYDADGNGSGAPVAIAQLTPGLSLSQYDIYVV